VAVVEAEQLRTKPDRENQHPDTAPSGDEEMAKLMNKNDDAENEQHRQATPAADDASNKIHKSVLG
jgi:hypothetical protein